MAKEQETIKIALNYQDDEGNAARIVLEVPKKFLLGAFDLKNFDAAEAKAVCGPVIYPSVERFAVYILTALKTPTVIKEAMEILDKHINEAIAEMVEIGTKRDYEELGGWGSGIPKKDKPDDPEKMN